MGSIYIINLITVECGVFYFLWIFIRRLNLWFTKFSWFDVPAKSMKIGITWIQCILRTGNSHFEFTWLKGHVSYCHHIASAIFIDTHKLLHFNLRMGLYKFYVLCSDQNSTTETRGSFPRCLKVCFLFLVCEAFIFQPSLMIFFGFVPNKILFK